MSNLAYDTFDELDTINAPTSVDELGEINALNFAQFLAVLQNRNPKEISTKKLIKFINTLGKNKSGGNNAISRLQFFLNAYIQELALKSANTDIIEFIGDDHYSLMRGYSGTNAADFYLHANDSNTYTIDAKVFYSESSFIEQRQANKINFHNADYCLVYLIQSKSWRFSRKVDNYNDLSSALVFAGSDPWLSELVLPKPLTLIRFFTKGLKSSEFSKIYDKDVPETVNYEFYQ
jgi:hypothetical protein